MKHRALSFLLTFLVLISALPFGIRAAELPREAEETVYFADGSYLVTTISDSGTRAAGTKAGYKTKSYYANNDKLVWEATLTATFTYNGTSSACTSGNCTVTISDSNWYVVSNSTTRSGSTATTQLTMGQKLVGITIAKPSFTITLSCDKDGKLG